MASRANATSYGASRGNKAGPGNRGDANHPATLRLKMRNALAARIDKLAAIADGQGTASVVTKDGVIALPPNFGDQLRALDTLAKYGVGTQQEVGGLDGAALTIRIVRDDA